MVENISSKKLRKAVEKRYGKKCYICGNVPGDTLDHFQPRSKGGKDTVDNLRPCCGECNRAKGDRWPVTVAGLRQEKRQSEMMV